MTRHRHRRGRRLSAPLAILTGIIVIIAAARLLEALILPAVTFGAVATAYIAGTRRRRVRVVTRRPAAVQPRPRPPAPHAALRATLRARANQVSTAIPAPPKTPERAS